MTSSQYGLGALMPEQPRKRRAGLIVGVAVFLAAGLGAVGVAVALGAGEDPAPAVAAGPTSAPPSSPPATVPVTTAPPAPTAARLGGKLLAADGQVEATVLAYRQPVAKDAPEPDEPGMVWGAAQIQVCAKAATSVSRFVWKLAYADGGLIEPSGTGYESFPSPEYPWEPHPLAAGRCAKGWVVFAVPPKSRPEFVQYLPEGNAMPMEWRV